MGDSKKVFEDIVDDNLKIRKINLPNIITPAPALSAEKSLNSVALGNKGYICKEFRNFFLVHDKKTFSKSSRDWIKACKLKERDVDNNNVTSDGISVSVSANNGSSASIPSGTLLSKFKPTLVADQVVEDGKLIWINGLLQCITCMKEYENKSLEEMRFED